MAEYSPDDQTPNPQPELQPKESPPPTPPSPDATESDVKLSRKREREVSLEPVITPKAAIDVDPLLRDHKETRTPAKKNRIHLDATQEEEDGVSPSRSPSCSPPPLNVSPPGEMRIRVRQISQGVEDLSWKNMKATTPEKEMETDSITALDKDEEDGDGVDAPREFEIPDEEVPPDNQYSSQVFASAMDVQPKEPQTGFRDSSNSLSFDMPSPRSSDSDSGEKDKGLKRKFVDRGTSRGPQENGTVPNQPVAEPLKRPRDDSDTDDNPRETKRPSPPPESDSVVKKPPRSPPPSPQRKGGFMAYASSSSPFASVKGQNIFSSSKPSVSPPPFSTSPATTSPFSPFSASLGEPSSSVPTAAKRTGFEAFASSSSPFASASRSKSPVLGSSKLNRNKSPSRRTNHGNVSAFSAYASGGVHGFAVPVQKRQRAGSPSGGSSRSSVERSSTMSVIGSNGGMDSGAEDDEDDRPVSFGEKLRAGKDDDSDDEDQSSKFMLTEQECMTGEEDEDTVHQVRGKLFSLSDGNQWKERGTGTLKLNVRRSDGNSARLVMRKEAVYTVLLNVTLFHGMRCVLAQDPRYLRFSVIEDGGTTHYNLRVSNAKIAQELMEEINANIPPA